MQPSYPRWYNKNAHCDYHSDNRGHLTEDCTALKRRVHNLIKARALAFHDEDVLDVNRNPLLDHQRSKINAVDSDPELQIKKDAKAVCIPMETVYEAFLKTDMLGEEQEKKEENEDGERLYCQYHKRFVGHSIQDCQEFLGLVQEMMNEGKIEFYKEVEGQAVNVLQKETPKSVIIYYRGGGQQAPTKVPIHPISKVVIKVPAPYRYSSDKAILWNYTNQVTSQKPQAVRVSLESEARSISQ